jgi:hypothetical protein
VRKLCIREAGEDFRKRSIGRIGRAKPDNLQIGVKAPAPEIRADHHHRSAAGLVFFGKEAAAQNRAHAENV